MKSGTVLKRYAVTTAAVIASAFLQAFAMQTFLDPVNILSSGFTGVAVLIERITSLYGIHFSTSLGMVALNVPVALFCFKHIGKKFVVFSMIQVFLASFFLRFAHFTPLFDDALLNICFGGFVYGMAIVTALKGNASTAGTDFIALYVSNRTGKAIWQYVFMGNACMLCIFGYMFGWEYAGVFHHVPVYIHPDHRPLLPPVQAGDAADHHPRSRCGGEGVRQELPPRRVGDERLRRLQRGQHEPATQRSTVYEVQDIVHHLKHADPKVIVNVLPTETFFGGFYQKPID